MLSLSCLVSSAGSRGDEREFEQVCANRLPPGRVSVTALPLQPRVDVSLSYLDLTRMAGREGGSRWVLGLTRPVLRMQARWEFSSLRDPDAGRVCSRPSLQLLIQYDPVQVYVGREFADDACAREFILAHELRHVEVHARRLREVALRLQSELQGWLTGGVYLESRERLQVRLETGLRSLWLKRAERSLLDLKREHEAVDSADEQARALGACDGRIARQLRDVRLEDAGN